MAAQVEDVTGARRSLWLKFEATVDWSHQPHVDRVLRVYENIAPDRDATDYESFNTLLKRDGFELDRIGRIVPHAASSEPTSSNADDSVTSGIIVGRRYQLDDAPLGEGGFGRVFMATDTMARFGDPERVVVKMLKREALQDASAVARFRQEIRIGFGLRHPKLLQILDSGGNDEEGAWYVSPYADGGSLFKLVQPGGLSVSLILEVIRDVCAGVQHLHNVDTLHRDLSPGNVLQLNGSWVVSDFGLSISDSMPASYVTSTGVGLLGTPAFISPEQRSSLHSATRLSDVYGLGKLLQYVTEGRWPEFEPVLSNPLRAVILRACAFEPSSRYPSVNAFLSAVEVSLAEPPVGAKSESNADIADRYELGLKAGRLGDSEAREILQWLNQLDVSVGRQDLLYRRVYGSLTYRDHLRMWRNDPERFCESLRVYCTLTLEADLKFAEVDEPASVIYQADRAAGDPRVREISIATLATLGQYYNRYMVRDLIVEMIKTTNKGPLVAPTVSGLRESDGGGWVVSVLNVEELPGYIRGWIRELGTT